MYWHFAYPGLQNLVRSISLEVFFIFLLLVGYLIFAARPRSKGRSNKKHQHNKLRPKRPSPTGPIARNDRPSQPAPFDATTTKPLLDPAILNGPAYIIDGDSIVIQKTQIRLFGIDAPEMNHPYGRNAKWALVGLCKGKTLRAEISHQDAYGRTVAKCYLPDGRDLSAEMVKLGLAIDWPKFSGGIYRAMEVPDARKKMWLADARQKGRIHIWKQYEARKKSQAGSS